jgi:hypothetical protein|tara:strand:- start:659 stop:880 length:222 start_codon:yes stop_codon:yes gene_type:complete
MDTIHHYSAMLNHVNSIQSRLAALAYDFKETAPRSDLDVQLIDALIATANQMLVEAEALKSVAYDPTPQPESE